MAPGGFSMRKVPQVSIRQLSNYVAPTPDLKAQDPVFDVPAGVHSPVVARARHVPVGHKIDLSMQA